MLSIEQACSTVSDCTQHVYILCQRFHLADETHPSSTSPPPFPLFDGKKNNCMWMFVGEQEGLGTRLFPCTAPLHHVHHCYFLYSLFVVIKLYIMTQCLYIKFFIKVMGYKISLQSPYTSYLDTRHSCSSLTALCWEQPGDEAINFSL